MFSKNSWWLKGLLSFYLIYHFSATLVLPNERSYIEQHFGFLYYPYTSSLGLTTPWQFFSPNPSRNIYFNYEVLYDEVNLEPEIHRWPPKSKGFNLLPPNQMRLVYHSIFSTSSEERKLRFFANYFCRKHQGATAIDLKTVTEEPPTLERAAFSNKSIQEQKEVKQWPAGTFYCVDALAPHPGVSQ